MQGINYPKISIVTSNFNGGKYLEQTILSVLSQNYPNLEYIIIDGGSTDESISIVKKYENKLAYWISEPDNGLYDGLQKGFDRATGEIMAWLNSDDMYHPNALLTVAEIFNSFKQIQWLQGNPTFFDEKNRIIGCYGITRWSKYDFYAGRYKWIQQESTFWRKDLWQEAGRQMDLTLKYAGDMELWLRFFRHAKLYVTPALLGGYRFRSKDQLMLDHSNTYFLEAEEKLKMEKISQIEAKITNRYKKLLLLCKYLDKLRIVRTEWLIRKFKTKYLEVPPIVALNRLSQQFELIA